MIGQHSYPNIMYDRMRFKCTEAEIPEERAYTAFRCRTSHCEKSFFVQNDAKDEMAKSSLQEKKRSTIREYSLNYWNEFTSKKTISLH